MLNGTILNFSDGLLEQIKAHATEAFPNECCGFVLKHGAHQRLFRCRNVSLRPKTEFYIPADDIIAAEAEGEILLSYHSHPNSTPAPTLADMTNSESNRVPTIIVSVTKDGDNVTFGGHDVYYPTGWKAALLGRPFFFGILDCYTLVRDYYASIGIDIPDYPREDLWWERGQNLYIDNFGEAGFVVVNELRKHDALLMTVNSPGIPNHCAVYVGDGHIMHHPPGRISCEHPYVENHGYYAKVTDCILRHKSLIT